MESSTIVILIIAFVIFVGSVLLAALGPDLMQYLATRRKHAAQAKKEQVFVDDLEGLIDQCYVIDVFPSALSLFDKNRNLLAHLTLAVSLSAVEDYMRNRFGLRLCCGTFVRPINGSDDGSGGWIQTPGSPVLATGGL